MVNKAVNGIIRSLEKTSHRPLHTQRSTPKTAFYKNGAPTGRDVVRGYRVRLTAASRSQVE